MTVGTLISYLQEQSDKGETHVYLDAVAREALKTTLKREKGKRSGILPSSVPAPSPAPSGRSLLTPVVAPSGSESGKEPLAKPVQPVQPAPSHADEKITEGSGTSHAAQPASSPPPVSEGQTHHTLSLPEGDARTKILFIKKAATHWSPALSLNSFRNKLVFATGTLETDVMFVGDAPGFEEELKKEPFVGKAGQKLNAILKAMGLSRKQVYLTNICKYRPSLPGQTMNNRKPSAEELASWMPVLNKEVEVIQPKCIVALGASAAEALTGQANAPVGRLRGTWHSYTDIPVRVSYHPSYLLRNEDNIKEKRKLWEDMLAVMEALELPISTKQREYFL